MVHRCEMSNQYKKFSSSYRCIFCLFEWGEIYYDGYPRPKEEMKGEICPRCGVPQKESVQMEPWRVHLRKFVHGIVNPGRRAELEKFIGENFIYVGNEKEKITHREAQRID